MRVTTLNPSPIRRRSWVDIPVPKLPIEQKRFRMNLRNWPVVRGRDIGDHTSLLHLYGEWKPNERVEGDLVLLTNPPPLPFSSSDWVADQIGDLVPHIVLKRANELGKNLKLLGQTLTIIEQNDARQVWRIRGRVETTMLVFDGWFYVYSNQDAVFLEGLFTNSDPSRKEIDETFDSVGFRTGEFFQMDFRDHYGLYFPWRSPDPNLDYHQLVALQRTLSDGQQIYFSGWMLCLPTPPYNFDMFDPTTLLRLDSLRAHMTTLRGGPSDQRGGPVLGMGDWPEGSWLAFGSLPQTPAKLGGGPLAFQQRIYESQVDLYDQKPKGLAKFAGQTGGQEDFGACKGGHCVTYSDPWMKEELRYMVSEFYRPFHNRQPDGSPITKESNPKLWTWSQLPIGTTEPGPADDLGKGFNGVWPPDRQGTGFRGEDDQHRSQNTFNAAYALHGNYAFEAILEDFLQIDRCQVPDRIGAPRAIGRLYMAWASMLRLLTEPYRAILIGHMWERMKVVEKDWKGKNVAEDRPIRVLTTGSDPSLLNPDGSRKLAWIVWEHAIATMGLYAASLQTSNTHALAYKQFAKHLAEMVALYGCFYDGIKWRCCTAVEYLVGPEEGNPVQYGVNSKSISISDSFWTWTLPAVIIAERLTEDPMVRERCEAIIEQVRGTQPSNWADAEWWAI